MREFVRFFVLLFLIAVGMGIELIGFIIILPICIGYWFASYIYVGLESICEWMGGTDANISTEIKRVWGGDHSKID